MNNFSNFVGIIASLCGIVALIVTIMNGKRIGRAGIVIISVILLVVIGAGVFISTSTTIIPHSPSNPLAPGATDQPTATPSPTTTLRVLQINQTMTVANPSATEAWTQFCLVVKTATVDPANNRVTLFIGLTNNSTQTTENSLAFLRFQDQVTGKTTDGSGDGFTDMNYAPTQTIFFNPVFLFTPVPRRTYQLSGSLTGFAVLTPIMITF